MTTKVTVSALHEWPVDVTGIGLNGNTSFGTERVETGAVRHFHVHSGMDLLIHEVHPTVKSHLYPGVALVGAERGEKAMLLNECERKAVEMLDALIADPGYDRRWLAIARTEIEKAFLIARKAIFEPGRKDVKA